MKRIIITAAFSIALLTMSCGNTSSNNSNSSMPDSTSGSNFTVSSDTGKGTSAPGDTNTKAGNGITGKDSTMNTGIISDSSKKRSSDSLMHRNKK
ncbi:MAG: hypothetical protein ACR2FN_10170 [Chitinophagaceae bacterium]